MTYKALPSSYNKDLQDDKEPLFDAVDTLSGSLQILGGVLNTLKVNDSHESICIELKKKKNCSKDISR